MRLLCAMKCIENVKNVWRFFKYTRGGGGWTLRFHAATDAYTECIVSCSNRTNIIMLKFKSSNF